MLHGQHLPREYPTTFPPGMALATQPRYRRRRRLWPTIILIFLFLRLHALALGVTADDLAAGRRASTCGPRRFCGAERIYHRHVCGGMARWRASRLGRSGQSPPLFTRLVGRTRGGFQYDSVRQPGVAGHRRCRPGAPSGGRPMAWCIGRRHQCFGLGRRDHRDHRAVWNWMAGLFLVHCCKPSGAILGGRCRPAAAPRRKGPVHWNSPRSSPRHQWPTCGVDRLASVAWRHGWCGQPAGGTSNAVLTGRIAGQPDRGNVAANAHPPTTRACFVVLARISPTLPTLGSRRCWSPNHTPTTVFRLLISIAVVWKCATIGRLVGALAFSVLSIGHGSRWGALLVGGNPVLAPAGILADNRPSVDSIGTVPAVAALLLVPRVLGGTLSVPVPWPQPPGFSDRVWLAPPLPSPRGPTSGYADWTANKGLCCDAHAISRPTAPQSPLV